MTKAEQLILEEAMGVKMKNGDEMQSLLTKREYFAGIALNAILLYGMNNEISNVFDVCAVDAVKMADSILAELDKKKD